MVDQTRHSRRAVLRNDLWNGELGCMRPDRLISIPGIGKLQLDWTWFSMPHECWFCIDNTWPILRLTARTHSIPSHSHLASAFLCQIYMLALISCISQIIVGCDGVNIIFTICQRYARDTLSWELGSLDKRIECYYVWMECVDVLIDFMFIDIFRMVM